MSSRAAVAVIGARFSPVPVNTAPGSTYDDFVASFGANVISYWKFQGTGTDEEGQENATITGTPDLGVATIVHFDTIAEGAAADGTCIAWPGTVGSYAQVAHDAAHKTAAGTIVVTAQHDTLSEKSTLVAGDANATTGGFSIEVNTNGSIRSFLETSGGVVVLTDAAGAGDVQLGRAYTHFFKWGTGGLSHSLWDDAGNLVRRIPNATTAGLAGTSPIRFGAWHTDTSHHDGPFARVVWMDRRIADTEEATLAKARTITRGGTGGTYTGPTVLTSAKTGDQLTSVGAVLIESQEPA